MLTYIFLDNGCQDHYEPAGNQCIRISAYKENYDDAQAKCRSEGSSLLYIESQEVQVSTKIHNQSRFIYINLGYQ